MWRQLGVHVCLLPFTMCALYPQPQYSQLAILSGLQPSTNYNDAPLEYVCLATFLSHMRIMNYCPVLQSNNTEYFQITESLLRL